MDYRRGGQRIPVAAVTENGVVEINDMTLPYTQKQYLGK